MKMIMRILILAILNHIKNLVYKLWNETSYLSHENHLSMRITIFVYESTN